MKWDESCGFGSSSSRVVAAPKGFVHISQFVNRRLAGICEPPAIPVRVVAIAALFGLGVASLAVFLAYAFDKSAAVNRPF